MTRVDRCIVGIVVAICGPIPTAQPSPTATGEGIRVATTEDLANKLKAAKPGDRIEIAAGRYGAISIANVAGSAISPIVVTAADSADPPVFHGGIHFADVEHLELSSLVVEGAPANGINIDDGGTFDTPSRSLRLERIVVRDVGGSANADGIKLSGVVDSTIVDCVIERWGRGGSGIDMVGCHRVRIESTTLRDHEHDLAASGIQAKGGSSEIMIRRCRFEHAGQRAVNLGGSTGTPYFRPSGVGYEAKDVTVEGCVFIGSLAPLACVGCIGAAMRFNTIVSSRKWILRILQESRGDAFVPCRDGSFTDNLVVYDGRQCREIVNVGSGTAPETFRFARNYWFRVDEPARSIPRLPTDELEPRGGDDPMIVDPLTGEVSDTSPATACGAAAWK